MNNYDDIPGVRRSALWEIRKSPAHYKYVVDHEKEPTAALLFGIAAHKYILEPDEFWREYALVPDVDRRTKAGKEEWNAYIAQLGSKTGLSIQDYTTILEMSDAIKLNSSACELLQGEHEVPVTWTDPVTGELCKCRVDCIHDHMIVDYKTTTSCSGFDFERSCRAYGYKLQAAMYTEGMFQTRLEEYGFAFVAQEKKEPYAVRVYRCDQGWIREGMDIYRELMGIYHECRINDSWPGYEDKELIADE